MHNVDVSNSDFEKIRKNNLLYVDKTLIVRDILNSSEILLCPRPRRFGKTLNIHTLKCFFDHKQTNSPQLFDGLKITQDADAMRHLNQYPVIHISLKDFKLPNWAQCYRQFKSYISQLYLDNQDVFSSLSEQDKKYFDNICNKIAEDEDYSCSLKMLISFMSQAHQKPVVLLIDEYDAPVIHAWTKDTEKQKNEKTYYNSCIEFMRSWFGGALKLDNQQMLFRAVVTGILRVTRESLFSGLNNLKVSNILKNNPLSDKFGFTEDEVIEVLKDHNSADKIGEARNWYNGYTFGDHVIYNPWSVMNYVDDLPNPPSPNWVNSSDNSLVYQELLAGNGRVRRDLEVLMNGGTVRYPLDECIAFEDIGKNPRNIWSFLYFCGYLNAGNPAPDPFDNDLTTWEVSIPNVEVGLVYKKFADRLYTNLNFSSADLLLKSLVTEDYAEFELLLNEFILSLMSFHDVSNKPEMAYHCFVLGLLANMRSAFEIRSNAETGWGRADILLIPRKKCPVPTGFCIEFKTVEDSDKAEAAAEDGFQQIHDKKYTTALLEAGVAEENIRRLSITCHKKGVIIKR